MTPRQATFAAFLSFGVCVGLWSGSIPTVAGNAGVSPSALGLATTASTVATILGLALAGRVARQVPIRHMLRGAVVLMALAAAVLMNAPGQVAFFGLFILFGLIAGFCDGTMNAEATSVERDLRRPVLVAFHAGTSAAMGLLAPVGSALSEGLGTAATALSMIAVGLAGAALVERGTPLRPIERGQPTAAAHGSGGRVTLPLILLGLVVGVSIAGEMSALMFSAATIRAAAPELAPWAGLGVLAYALCQAAVRSLADRVRRHVSDPVLILGSIALAFAGFCLIAVSSGSIVGIAAGLAIVGVGTASIVPCGFVLAPRVSGLAAARAIGYLSLVSAVPRIPVPWLFGAVAETHGYPPAYLLNAALMAIAFAIMIAMILRARRNP